MSPSTDSQTSLTLMEMLREDPRNAVAWERFVRRITRRYTAGAGPGACKRQIPTTSRKMCSPS